MVRIFYGYILLLVRITGSAGEAVQPPWDPAKQQAQQELHSRLCIVGQRYSEYSPLAEFIFNVMRAITTSATLDSCFLLLTPDSCPENAMTRLLSLISILVLPALAYSAAPAVTAAAYHPKGKSAAFGAAERVWIVTADRGEVMSRVAIPSGRVTALTYEPNGAYLAVAGGEAGKDGLVWLFAVDAEGRLSANPYATLAAHKDSVFALAFAPDGKTLATAGYDRVIHLWNVPSVASPSSGVPTPKLTLKDHSDTIYGLSFHPSGELLASAAADRAVKVWDVATGTRLYTLGDPTDWVYRVAWSPDRVHLAAGGVDKSVRMWTADKNGGKLVHSVFAHDRPVHRLVYNAEGTSLFTAGEDRTIKAWNAATMSESKVYSPQPETVLALALRPDGKQLAVGRFDGVALLLDVATGANRRATASRQTARSQSSQTRARGRRPRRHGEGCHHGDQPRLRHTRRDQLGRGDRRCRSVRAFARSP